jgi:alpha-tubulin suppressor-like RCC1 family protein
MRLDNTGALYAMGYNTNGELGVNDVIARSSPVQVSALLQQDPLQIAGSWSQVATSGFVQHTAAIRTDGSLWVWGRNDYGQLGQNDTVVRKSPIQVMTGTSFTTVTTGTGNTDGVAYTIALTTDNRLFAWGAGQNGVLGTSDTINRSSPTQIGSAYVWAKLYGGGNASMAKTITGELFAWGLNTYGSIFSNDTVSRSSPVQITTLGASGLQATSSPIQVGANSNWATVSAGEINSTGLTTSGTLFVWGSGITGANGDSTTVARSSPVQLTSLSYSQVAAGSSYFVTIVDNAPYFGKRMLATGYNAQGQLGINTVVASSNLVGVSTMMASNASSPVQVGSSGVNYRSSPVQIGTDSWYEMAAGGNHSLGINSSGSLFGWGYNQNGQVGDSTTINKSSPVQISSTTAWVDVEAGYNYSVVENSDGSIYTFGNNSDGQLGDGT